MISYSDSAAGLGVDQLRGGFFEGWAAPPEPAEHLRILRNSSHLVLARNDAGAVVGFVERAAPTT